VLTGMCKCRKAKTTTGGSTGGSTSTTGGTTGGRTRGVKP